jgi:hypothetical protein
MQEKTASLSKTDQQKTTKFDIEIKLKQKFIFETKVHPVRSATILQKCQNFELFDSRVF